MTELQPASTAISAAMARAAHLFMDEDPKIFRDDLAMQLAGFVSRSELECALEAREIDRARRAAPDFERAAFSRARAIMCVRSRYAEEALADAIRHGVRQYVILGAGLDSFAWRRPELAACVRVFEVDHPSTQDWKRARLAHLGMSPPENLCFVPVDFERHTLREALDAAGYRAQELAFFSCLGLTQYLTRAAATHILRYIASVALGSEIVLEYLVPVDQLESEERQYLEVMKPVLGDGRQPWRAFYEPSQVIALLEHLGFVDVTDLDSELINTRYFSGRHDGLCAPASAHLVKATVGVVRTSRSQEPSGLRGIGSRVGRGEAGGVGHLHVRQ